MAIVFIKDSDHSHADPTKDNRGAYKRGDVVSVYDDHEVGPISPNFKMKVLRIPGLSKRQLEKYIQPEYEIEMIGELEHKRTTKRRKYRFDLDRFFPNADKFHEADFSTIRKHLFNKRTRQTEAGAILVP